jgi:hypothetical protein
MLMNDKNVDEKLNDIGRVLIGVRRFLVGIRTERKDAANVFLDEMLDDVSDWEARLAQLQSRYARSQGNADI